MSKSNILKPALIIGGIFNLGAALMVIFPGTLGRIFELPVPGTIFYNAILAYLVALFGAVYIWMTRQPTLDKTLLFIFGIGKVGVFVVALYCLLTDVVSFKAFSVAIGDLIFGTIYLWGANSASGGR